MFLVKLIEEAAKSDVWKIKNSWTLAKSYKGVED